MYTHEDVLDGAEGVWAEGEMVAVWHGGRTLNLYADAAGGWKNAGTAQWMEQPTRDEVAETARQELEPEPDLGGAY